MGSEPRGQLAGVEGLGDVVIGADLEADHHVHLGIAPGQHDDRATQALAPKLSADLDAVDVREDPVQQHNVGLTRDSKLDSLLAGSSLGDLVTIPAARLGNDCPDRGVVLDQKDLLAPTGVLGVH